MKNRVAIKREGLFGCFKVEKLTVRKAKWQIGKYNYPKIGEKQIKYFHNMKFLVYLPIVLQVSL